MMYEILSLIKINIIICKIGFIVGYIKFGMRKIWVMFVVKLKVIVCDGG